MRVSLLLHARQFLKLVAYQTVPLLPAPHLALHRGQPEEEGLLREVLEGVVDSSAQEDAFIRDEGDEHEVVGRVGVFIEEVGGQHFLRFLENYVLGLVFVGSGWHLPLR